MAVEEPEEAFAKRNFGKNYGKLYKPDYRRLEDPNQDVALQYTGDSIGNYDNIFRNQKFKTSDEDKRRLIESLQKIAERRDLEEAVDIEQVMRYFAVQVFVVNLDSYLGPTGHNYFLYEEDGRLQMLPWDYNLAFATYSLGMPDPINDSELYVNYPIDTPASGDIMVNRPMFHNLMLNADYFETYHKYFDQLISTYFESGYFEKKVAAVRQLISPYVKTDPTAYCSYADYETGVKTITDFCLLRAESVRGQLNGEIPSTIKGQQEDSSKRIDASGVWLPDMGEIADLKD
ncbi:MAG: CotH kinase family protein [Emergencia sp.]